MFSVFSFNNNKFNPNGPIADDVHKHNIFGHQITISLQGPQMSFKAVAHRKHSHGLDPHGFELALEIFYVADQTNIWEQFKMGPQIQFHSLMISNPKPIDLGNEINKSI